MIHLRNMINNMIISVSMKFINRDIKLYKKEKSI